MNLRDFLMRLVGLEKRIGYRHCRNCPHIRLSEWFIAPDAMRRWGMFCIECGWVSPWLEHAPPPAPAATEEET